MNKFLLPTHVEVSSEYGFRKTLSCITSEQIRTIDKKGLERKVGYTDDFFMRRVNEALIKSVGV